VTNINRIKWKPGEENTVDFRVDVRGTPDAPMFWIQIVANKSEHEDVAELTPEPELVDAWRAQPPHHRIIECRYDPDWPNSWRFTRFRDDKDTANHLTVMESIIESIQDNVTKEELVGKVTAWRRAWKIRNNEPLGNEDQVEQESRRFLAKASSAPPQPDQAEHPPHTETQAEQPSAPDQAAEQVNDSSA